MAGQTSFLQSLGWAVLNSFWQMALLWVTYQALNSLFRSLKSSHRSSLAFTFLLTGFAWFIYTFFSVYSEQSTTGTAITSPIIVTGNSEVNQGIQSFLPVASVIYLLLLIVPVSRFIRNYRYVQVIRKYGLAKIDVQWRVFVQKVAAQMGIQKTVHIWVSEFITSPVTIGFLKPVILMPLAAINHLSVQQMESVLLHELSHIRRHDYLINLVINFIRTILYFNPFVKAFVRIIEREREKSCDETVLQFQYNSYDYATALLTLEQTNHTDQKTFILPASGHKNDLVNRIEAIVGIRKKKRFTFNKVAGVIAGLLCIIAFNAFFISGKEVKTNKALAVSEQYSSFASFENEDTKDPEVSPLLSVSRTRPHKTPLKQTAPSTFVNAATAIGATPGFMYVNFTEPEEVKQLDTYQEAQVKAAMDASKKVLENAEWKSLEKNIADVLTQREKEELKKVYRKEINKVDWKSLENRLRSAYDNVDWNTVNEQLSKAVNNIRLDSLQKVYNQAICKLDETSTQLLRSDLKGIPDTDITIKAIEEKKLEMQKALNKLKSTRTKKIVHL